MIEGETYADSPNRDKTGYRDGGNYTYVKTFSVLEGDTGKYIVKFEGVYAHALVYVNQQLAGTEANGYAAFYVDLTGYLHPGEENELRVQVKNAGMTNSRWYSGSGLYRDVYLLRSGPVYIEPDSVQVTTESADEEYAVLSVKTAVANETPAPKELCLSTAVAPQKGGASGAGPENTVFFLKPGEKRTITQRILRGACIHHDSGIIGAATYEDAYIRLYCWALLAHEKSFSIHRRRSKAKVSLSPK